MSSCICLDFSIDAAGPEIGSRKALRHYVEGMRSWLSQLDFAYKPPPGFGTRKIKGLVASLLAPKPEDHRKGMGFKIAAAPSCTTSSWKTNARRQGAPRTGRQETRVIPPIRSARSSFVDYFYRVCSLFDIARGHLTRHYRSYSVFTGICPVFFTSRSSPSCADANIDFIRELLLDCRCTFVAPGY